MTPSKTACRTTQWYCQVDIGPAGNQARSCARSCGSRESRQTPTFQKANAEPCADSAMDFANKISLLRRKLIATTIISTDGMKVMVYLSMSRTSTCQPVGCTETLRPWPCREGIVQDVHWHSQVVFPDCVVRTHMCLERHLLMQTSPSPMSVVSRQHSSCRFCAQATSNSLTQSPSIVWLAPHPPLPPPSALELFRGQKLARHPNHM